MVDLLWYRLSPSSATFHLAPRPPQRFKRVENPGQALFSRATAFQTGFDGEELHGGRGGPDLGGLIVGGGP